MTQHSIHGDQTEAEAVAHPGSLAGLIGYHLRLAQEASYQAIVRRLGESNSKLPYKPGHYTVLTLIAENPGMTQTAMSVIAGRDKSSLTPILNDFVKLGLVRREPIAGDRRSYGLRLTPKGEAVRQELHAVAQAHEAELDRIVGPENKAYFIALLRRIKMALG